MLRYEMRAGQSYPEGGEASDLAARYRREGYAIVRGLFSTDEITVIGLATDQIYAEGVRRGRSFRHGNLFYNVAEGADGAPIVRLVQWPSYHQPVLNAVRLDRRIAKVLQPLIGSDMKKIINQVHWKPKRSEEHTSELQSLMRISYADFC